MLSILKHIIYINKVSLDSTLPAVNFSLGNVYGLAQAGASVIFMAQTNDKHFHPQKLYEQFALKPLDNLIIRPWFHRKKWGIRTNQWFYIDAFAQIRQWIRAGKTDAVISRDPGALPYLVRLNRTFQIPVFYQPHNFYWDLSIRDDVNQPNVRKYQSLEKKYIPQLTGLLCLQQVQADLYQRYLPDFYIANAMPGVLPFNDYSEKKKKYDIGYVGSLQQKKGIDVLLQAFSLLADKSKTMILIGGRHEKELHPIQEKVKQMGLEHRITLTGYVPYHGVRNFLNEIRVGVLPLKNSFYNQYLTAPNKLFDYIGMGIPVIASDLPSIRAFLKQQKDGLLVPPDNAESLAEAIEALLGDSSLYRHLAENVRQAAKIFSWKKRGAAMLAVMKDAIKSSE